MTQWMIAGSESQLSFNLARVCVAPCAVLSDVFSVHRCFCEDISARSAQTMLGSSAFVLEWILSAEGHSLHKLLMLLAYRWATSWCPSISASKIM